MRDNPRKCELSPLKQKCFPITSKIQWGKLETIFCAFMKSFLLPEIWFLVALMAYSRTVLLNMVATIHVWLLSTWSVGSSSVYTGFKDLLWKSNGGYVMIFKIDYMFKWWCFRHIWLHNIYYEIISPVSFHCFNVTTPSDCTWFGPQGKTPDPNWASQSLP